jgi:hypothetical protein
VKEVAERLHNRGHQIEIMTTTADDVSAFTHENAGKIYSAPSDDGPVKVKRYDPLAPYRMLPNRDLYWFPFVFEAPGPFCPEMYTEFADMAG